MCSSLVVQGVTSRPWDRKWVGLWIRTPTVDHPDWFSRADQASADVAP